MYMKRNKRIQARTLKSLSLRDLEVAVGGYGKWASFSTDIDC